MNLALRSTAVWLGFLVIAFANGALREIILIKQLGIDPLVANQLSCLTGITLWTGLLLAVWKKLEIRKFTESAAIGAGWFIATVLFETFILGRNLSWPEIAHTYDVTAGELWGLVLTWLGLMPIVIYWKKDRR